MKMKEAEARTGLDRKNIRYYESEELLAPRRTEGNRYRDYSEEDIERLLEIRFLRQLGIPIRDLELLTIGMVTDMLIEAGNDGAEYDMLPTQEDFDAF